MKKATNPAHTELLEEFVGHGYRVLQFKTGDLAIFSYLIESAGEALLLDPTFDHYSYDEQLGKSGAKLKFVALTHFHADYLSGHLEFGKVPIIMGERSKRAGLGFEVEEFKSGSTVKLGEIKLMVLHTPGHTLESSCYLLTDRDGKEEYLFTGDTVFLGEVGRPDLAVSKETSQDDLAGMLYDSLQKLRVLKPSCKILPGHGSGSSCGKFIGEGNVCTLENQFKKNHAFQYHSRDDFIKKIAEGISKPPQYFFHDAKLNQQGHQPYDAFVKKAKTLLTLEKWKEFSSKGHPVIDTRSNNDNLQKGYIKGAWLLAEGGALPTWLGSLFDPKTEFLIFAEKDKIDDIAERVIRIGYTILGFNGFTIDEWKNAGGELTIPKFATVQNVKDVNPTDRFILDVRGEEEHKKERIQGSVNIPFGKLHQNIDKIPKGKKIFVHCMAGNRAKIGGSILSQHGIDSHPVPVKFGEFGSAGLPIVKDQ